MISKEETREMLSVIGSSDCTILISAFTVDEKLKDTKTFTDSDEALEWVVDELTEQTKLIITIS